MKKLILIVFAVVLVFGIIGGIASKKENTEKSEMDTTEQKGVTGIEVKKEKSFGEIEDFSYKVSENTIIINSYKGNSDTLEINPTYAIDGKEYITDISKFQVGIGNHSVETLILNEGITEVYTSIFNSCNVKCIFFPKSMTNVYDYTLSYLHPNDGETIKIYYAGTQEEWAEIFSEYERTKIEDAEFGSELGSALADKLNKSIGVDYDSSLFEFFFSANADDLK